MDSGKGYFIPVQITPEEKDRIDEQTKTIEITDLASLQGTTANHGGTFYIGQNLNINGSKFRVIQLGKKTMTLKLLPKVSARG